ncbi:MAG TPA: universal stress protein [Nitrososphaeraceae archaeon]|nr:universal stress protein [Nitrososphaeraceae archaeon]
MSKVVRKKTFSRILVAINDSSKAADKSVYYSTRIAEDYDALLVVLYVIRTQTDLDTATIPSHVIDFKKQAQVYLAKILEKIHKHNDTEIIIKVKTDIIASNKIADAIVNYAKDKRIDLIIVGPRGISKLKSLVLGSVTSDVVRLANCPVLTVR